MIRNIEEHLSNSQLGEMFVLPIQPILRDNGFANIPITCSPSSAATHHEPGDTRELFSLTHYPPSSQADSAMASL
jgi:hypothetical protein